MEKEQETEAETPGDETGPEEAGDTDQSEAETEGSPETPDKAISAKEGTPEWQSQVTSGINKVVSLLTAKPEAASEKVLPTQAPDLKLPPTAPIEQIVLEPQARTRSLSRRAQRHR